MEDELKKNIPHIVIIGLLLVAGLFVLTKFSWIRCSDVPGWCSVYCKLVGNSRIALISGRGAIGDGDEFSRKIMEYTYHVVEDIPTSQLSLGVLQKYDLVIVEGVKNITKKEIEAIELYLDSGGNIIWVGDAGTAGVEGLPEELIGENKTNESKGYIAGGLNMSYWKETGLTDYLLLDYEAEVKEGKKVALITIDMDHPIMLGLKKRIDIKKTKLAVVMENPAGLTKVANIEIDGTEYPAILENKYVGRIVYFAFPPEDIDSPTFIMNLVSFLINC